MPAILRILLAHSRSLFQPISILIYLAPYTTRIDFLSFFSLSLGKLFNILDDLPTDDIFGSLACPWFLIW
jgi:hypothetical protein